MSLFTSSFPNTKSWGLSYLDHSCFPGSFGESSALSTDTQNNQWGFPPSIVCSQNKLHRSFSYYVVTRILSCPPPPRSLLVCASTLCIPSPCEWVKLNVEELIPMIMLLYLAKEIFTEVMNVHNQFASSLHQKECKISSRQSYFIISASSITQLCLTLCNPIDCSTPGFPVHHLPEISQIHVHWVSDAIQPSHPLSSLSPPPFNLSQHQGIFQWVSSSHISPLRFPIICLLCRVWTSQHKHSSGAVGD